ncbi:MAG: hypothetical protein R3F62_25400 [Planctomycetota bacterium]
MRKSQPWSLCRKPPEERVQLDARPLHLGVREGELAVGDAEARAVTLWPLTRGGATLEVREPSPRVYLNHRRLTAGARRRLRAGDVLQVGPHPLVVVVPGGRVSTFARQEAQLLGLAAVALLAALVFAAQLLLAPLGPEATIAQGTFADVRSEPRARLALDEAARLARVGALDQALRVIELAEEQLPREEDQALLAQERGALLERQRAAQTLPASFRPALQRPEPQAALHELRARVRVEVLDPGDAAPPSELPTEVLLARFERGDRGSSAARAELLRRGPAAALAARAALARRPQATWLQALVDEIEAAPR